MVRSNSGLSVEVQQFILQHGSTFKIVKFVRGSAIAWEGWLQPSPLNKKYKVRIDYEYLCRPKVTLPEELFEPRPVHTFSDGSLCLYHRKGLGSWNARKPINQILPMISHWLWCYELWKATGIWFGEEYPHEINEEKEPT